MTNDEMRKTIDSMMILNEEMKELVHRLNIKYDRFEGLVKALASDELFESHSSDWHDTGKMQEGIQILAKTALALNRR